MQGHSTCGSGWDAMQTSAKARRWEQKTSLMIGSKVSVIGRDFYWPTQKQEARGDQGRSLELQRLKYKSTEEEKNQFKIGIHLHTTSSFFKVFLLPQIISNICSQSLRRIHSFFFFLPLLLLLSLFYFLSLSLLPSLPPLLRLSSLRP